MNRSPAPCSAPARLPPNGPQPAGRSALFGQVEGVIGGRAAGQLIADFGGRRLYVPLAPAPGDLVTRSIGINAAMEFARVFGGDRLLIPAGAGQLRRRGRILAMCAEGVSVSRIAHQLHCTERYVYKVLAIERLGSGAAPNHPASAPAPFGSNRGLQRTRS